MDDLAKEYITYLGKRLDSDNKPPDARASLVDFSEFLRQKREKINDLYSFSMKVLDDHYLKAGKAMSEEDQGEDLPF